MKQAFLIIVFLCISYQSYAIDCPPNSCTMTFASNTFGLVLDDYGSSSDEKADINIRAEIRWRYNCDGEFEIIIDEFFISSPDYLSHEHLEEFQYLHYNFSSLTEWAALDFLMIINAYGKDTRTVPFCSTGNSIERVHVYTAACGIWLRCSYKLPNPVVKVCDTGWQGGDPHYGVLNDDEPPTTDMWVDHWKWQSCGEVCCRKIYEICRDENLTYPGPYIKIKALTKEKYPDSECSEESNFSGPRPFPNSDVKPLDCEDGC